MGVPLASSQGHRQVSGDLLAATFSWSADPERQPAGCDVSDASQVEDAVAAIEAELGPPTVLVNNAGVTRDALLFKMTDVEWDTVIGVHLRGSFLMARAVQHRRPYLNMLVSAYDMT
jgi:NAD(P)-dependent dehydrogenase (short-subunit alcohol dehydrogenase family)